MINEKWFNTLFTLSYANELADESKDESADESKDESADEPKDESADESADESKDEFIGKLPSKLVNIYSKYMKTATMVESKLRIKYGSGALDYLKYDDNIKIVSYIHFPDNAYYPINIINLNCDPISFINKFDLSICSSYANLKTFVYGVNIEDYINHIAYSRNSVININSARRLYKYTKRGFTIIFNAKQC